MEGLGLYQQYSSGINGGELRGQPANRGSPGKIAVEMECVCVCSCVYVCWLVCGRCTQ